MPAVPGDPLEALNSPGQQVPESPTDAATAQPSRQEEADSGHESEEPTSEGGDGCAQDPRLAYISPAGQLELDSHLNLTEKEYKRLRRWAALL